MNRYIISLFLFIIVISFGCKGISGPIQTKRQKQPDPMLSLNEQRRDAYARYPIFDNDYRTLPYNVGASPSPSGR